jgi:hypothetical protein
VVLDCGVVIEGVALPGRDSSSASALERDQALDA